MKTNVKLMVSLCGLALSSVLLINNKSVVHADSLDNDNQNSAITWDSDKTQSAAIAQLQEASINSNALRHDDVQSKVSRVEADPQAPVTKTKVAQFNQNSQIYGLNNNSELSKTNGDGYVITNAGTYNGRKVDIGVTINNVQDNQGTYTTKWSNGDKADVTDKTDANFKYQDSVLLSQQVTDPNLTQTRPRTETQNVQNQLTGVWIKYNEDYSAGGVDQNVYVPTLIDPKLIADTMTLLKCDEPHAVYALLTSKDLITQSGINLGNYDYFLKRKWNYHYTDDFGPYVNTKYFKADRGFYDDDTASQSFDNPWYDVGRSRFIHYNLVQPNVTVTSDNFGSMFRPDFGVTSEVITGTVAKDKKGKLIATQLDDVNVYSDSNDNKTSANKINSILSHISSNGYKFTMSEDVQVTDHLQVDSSTPAKLSYNYKVGVYDAETGELIDSLIPEYKGLKGVRATNSDTAMNTAIKNKINQINQNKAIAAYTGTKANDDVAFYEETRNVDPASDARLRAVATRTIQIKFPGGVVPKSYDKVCDSTGLIKQTVNFTRTGTENLANGEMMFGAWKSDNKDSSFIGFEARTLPRIPGYTLKITPAQA